MEDSKKRGVKLFITFLILLILFEIVLVWYLLRQFHENYLSGEEAMEYALLDAGTTAAERKIRLKTKAGRAWYEIRFDGGDGASYVYEVDAETGAILSAAKN